jgi:hypothetical protein
MLIVLALLGCNEVCDTAALDSATTGAEAEAACAVPGDLTATWTCSTPLPSDNDVNGLEAIHTDCGLGALGDAEDFATGTGDPARAAAFYLWAVSAQVPDATAAHGAGLIAGDPLFEGELPRVAKAAKVDMKPATALPAYAGAWKQWGAWPGYHDDALEGDAFLVAADADVKDLRYAVASRATATEPVWVTVIGDQGLTQVPLYAPGEHPEVAFASDATVNSILAKAAEGPTALALGASPCGESPEGMVCVGEGQGLTHTVFLDTAGSGDLKDCRDEGYCTGSRGSYDAARQYCSFTGKRLPTPEEWDAAQPVLTDVGDEWTSTQHLFPKAMGYGHLNVVDASLRTLKTSTGARRADNVRCAVDQPWLASYPPATVSDGLDKRGLPTEPDAELVTRAHDIVQDELDDKGICGEDVRANWRDSLQNGGRSTTNCRDPFSYVTPNEPRRYTFGPYIQNLGGGYVGVGSDQSYDFIAEAKSEWAWVFDYDPNVVRLHKVLEVLVPAAEGREDFVSMFSDAGAERARGLIEDEVLEAFYNGYRTRLHGHYTRSLKPREATAPADFGWLTNDEDFTYIQTMYSQGRLIPIGADMLKNESLVNVGKAAEDMGVPIRIYYTSNAPTAWGGQATPEYKGNVLGLPMDSQSVVLATFNTGGFGQTGYWHQSIAWGPLVQERYATEHVVDNYKYVWDRIPGHDPDVTVVGLPSTHPPGTGKKATP